RAAGAVPARGGRRGAADRPRRRRRRRAAAAARGPPPRGGDAMSGTLGLQLPPWQRTEELVAVGETLRDVVDVVWVQDQLLARNVWVVLTALAQTGCGIGTNVTYPIGR